VLESSGEGSSLALDGDFSGLEVNINSFRDVKLFFSENVFHCLVHFSPYFI